MLLSTSPVTVLFRGTYGRETDPDPARFRSGKLVEYVKLMDPETGEIFDWTLAEHINGEVQVQETYSFTVEQRATIQAWEVKGQTRTRTVYKHKIVGAKPAKPAAAVA